MSRVARTVAAVASLLAAGVAAEDFGQLNVRREQIGWSSPEQLARDLRSPNDGARLAALRAIGVPDAIAQAGAPIATAGQIEVRYAALGRDETKQTVLVAQVAGVYAYAAVAVPVVRGWRRIAVVDCWCRYEGPSLMDAFASLARAPDGRFELILRGSGGGTGLYRQDEVHFRIDNRDLKPVMSFVSRVQSSPAGHPPPWYLDIERRWFHPAVEVRMPDGSSRSVAILAEARGRTPVPPDVYFSIPELQSRYLDRLACRAFQWDPGRFRYEPVSIPDPCRPTNR